MTDDLEDLDLAPKPKVSHPVMAAILSILFGSIGIFFFIKDFNYFENGQIVLIVLFALFMALFFYGINKVRLGKAVFALFLAIIVIIFSQAKYNWRKEYVSMSRSNKPFALDFYIDSYPPFEDYLIASYLEKPDWVRFSRDCVEPALEERQYKSACSSMKKISETYFIDVQEALREYRNKMARTAMRIESGHINSKRRYIDCIAKRQCVPVPLLPPGVKPDSIEPESSDFLEERRAFWQLVDSNEITAEICDFMTLCKALKKTGALSFR